MGKLDILLHLPKVIPPGMATACVAHSLKFNLCVVGETPEVAIGKLVDLIEEHCAIASQMGIRPVNLAANHLMQAFFLGTPYESAQEGIEARLSRHTECSSLAIRDIRTAQEETGQYDLELYVRDVAA